MCVSEYHRQKYHHFRVTVISKLIFISYSLLGVIGHALVISYSSQVCSGIKVRYTVYIIHTGISSYHTLLSCLIIALYILMLFSAIPPSPSPPIP